MSVENKVTTVNWVATVGKKGSHACSAILIFTSYDKHAVTIVNIAAVGILCTHNIVCLCINCIPFEILYACWWLN